MTNFEMCEYMLDRLNIHFTYNIKDDFSIIETEERDFYFNQDGSFYSSLWNFHLND